PCSSAGASRPMSTWTTSPTRSPRWVATCAPDASDRCAPLPARLLTTEATAILAHPCTPRPRVVTRHAIAQDVTTRLTRGLTTTSAGGGGLPSLLHRGASALTTSWGPAKRAGRPRAHLALGLVFASSCGSTAGRRAGDTVRRADC